jgi:gamma-glutamylcyclotransferase (GGCT)/AIG2-like uncharacterized protein YtfP
MSQPMTEFLPFFVYGTLLPDQPNFHYWDNKILAIETAVFPNGRIYDFGNYPMLIEAENGSVIGKLISIDLADYKTILNRLDQLEGYDPEQPNESSYIRAKRDVQDENGRIQSAWVYIGQYQFPSSTPIIKNGDWIAYIAHKQNDVNEWWKSVTHGTELPKTPDQR